MKYLLHIYTSFIQVLSNPMGIFSVEQALCIEYNESGMVTNDYLKKSFSELLDQFFVMRKVHGLKCKEAICTYNHMYF